MENNDVKEVMWLRDLLPTCIPNARIATFSYPSDWFTYRRGVKTSLRELGEQLLNALELDRKKWNVGSDKNLCVSTTIESDLLFLGYASTNYFYRP